MIIAELFPLKFKVTFSVSRLTLPVIDVSEAPHRDFISIDLYSFLILELKIDQQY